jgi:hypothetical protein
MGEVKLIVKPSPEVASALRGLVNGFSATEGKEVYKRLLIATEFVRIHIDDLRRQLKKMVHISGNQRPLRVAAHALALGAILRTTVPYPSNAIELLNAVLTPWQTDGEYPDTISKPPQLSRSWQSLLGAYTRLADRVREWLIKEIGCRKGKRLDAGMVDSASLLGDLNAAIECVGPIKPCDQFEKWNRQVFGDILELNERINTYFDRALAEETTQCQAWLENVKKYIGEEDARKIGETLKEAIELGLDGDVLHVRGAIELPSKCLILTEGGADKQLEQARIALGKGSLNARLRALASLNRSLMGEMTAFLKDAENALTEGLKVIQRRMDQEGLEDPTKLQEEIQSLLEESESSLIILQGETNHE